MKKLLAATIAVILISLAHVLAYDPETADQQEALMVQNWKGEFVGTITNAPIDSSGRIRFVIVSISERMGEKEIAVPIACFSTNKERKLLLNLSNEKLAAAPEFGVSDLTDPTFAENVYRFYGLMPPWAEGPIPVEL